MRPPKNLLGITVFVAATVLVACGDEGDGRQLVERGDVGSEVTVDLGEEFEVRLESNPTTGYAWRVAEQPDAVALVSSDFEAPEGELVGAGGVEVFVFQGAAEGSGTLRFEYVRSFENPAVPADTADYRVRVTGTAE